MQKKNKQTVSVVIPTYNCPFLREAIDSVLRQTCLPDEIIVVDDGSLTKVEPLERYRGKVKYLYQENTGQAGARNLGVSNAIGDWVAFLDSDDLWNERKLEEQFTALFEFPDYGCVACGAVLINNLREPIGLGSGNFLGKTRPLTRLEFILNAPNAILVPSMVVIKKEAFLKAGGFEAKFQPIEDLVFFDKLLKSTDTLIVEKPLLFRRIHGDNLTFKYLGMLKSYLLWISERLERELTVDELSKLKALVCEITGLSAYYKGKDSHGRILLKKALKYNPNLRRLLFFSLSILGSTFGNYLRIIKRYFSSQTARKILLK
ncbi:MAG: glycosyltransferase family 2 protein [Candidatus Riflebacteria bacterium]|nr:glycosyltransferase family 2 protein [Candidatus Riflebacteria bacterium]